MRKNSLGWSVEDIDRTVHEPARYQILSVLFVVESADFRFIQTQTGLTKGNLSSHMSKLEETGYIKVIKEFVGRKPHTMLKLTKEGRRAFISYRETMSSIIVSG